MYKGFLTECIAELTNSINSARACIKRARLIAKALKPGEVRRISAASFADTVYVKDGVSVKDVARKVQAHFKVRTMKRDILYGEIVYNMVPEGWTHRLYVQGSAKGDNCEIVRTVEREYVEGHWDETPKYVLKDPACLDAPTASGTETLPDATDSVGTEQEVQT